MRRLLFLAYGQTAKKHLGIFILLGFMLACVLQASAGEVIRKERTSLGYEHTWEKTAIPPIDIVGTVKDSLGSPLAGATVALKGTSTATKTDANGNFSLRLPDNGGVLEVSYVGYVSAEMAISQAGVVNIVLHQHAVRAEDAVVVVAFGKQKKISVVGSQSTVKADDLKLPVAGLTNSLVGRLAGVQGVSRSGEPGYNSSEIYIRGVSTIGSGSKTPLLVVDGVPNRGIDQIDPEDIESFTILKDASSTAPYGSLGANGVILITTKRGKNAKPVINAEYNRAITKFTQLPSYLRAVDYTTTYNEARMARGKAPVYTAEQIEHYRNQDDPDVYPDVNWFDEIFNKYANNQRINLNLRGGGNVANYYVSLGYFTEEGMLKSDPTVGYDSKQKYGRFNYTTNLDIALTKTTKLEFGVTGYIEDYNAPDNSFVGISSAGSPAEAMFFNVTRAVPHSIPARYSNGQWPRQAGNYPSPYLLLTQEGYRTYYENTTRANLRATQQLDFITKGLSATALYAFDAYAGTVIQRIRNTPLYYIASPGTAGAVTPGRDAAGNLVTVFEANSGNSGGILGFASGKSTNRRVYLEGALNYNRTFGDHSTSGMLLFNQSDYINGDATDIRSSIPFRTRSFVGRATYGFKDRYFAEGNFSYMGSENFAPDNRYGFFPSYGVGWVVSKEKFFDGLSDVIDYFKIRYSFGHAGFSDPGQGNRFLYLTNIASGTGYTFGVPTATTTFGGFQEALIGNNKVQWEDAARHNLGVEINLLRNSLQLVAEVFKEHRKNILVKASNIPYASGYTASNIPYGNVGVTENKGIDISLNYNKQFKSSAFFSFNGNFTYNINKVIANGEPDYRYPWQQRKGQPIGQRYGLIALGLFKDSAEILSSPYQIGDVRPGDIKYLDVSGDGRITVDDQVPIGYGSMPRISYGLNFVVGYKGFDLGLFFQGAGQVDFMYDTWTQNVRDNTQPFSGGITYSNMYSTLLDHWTPDYNIKNGSNATPFYPRLSESSTITTNYTSSTWWLKRADYIRLKSAEIGYSFNVKALKRFAVNKMRLYVNGTNLWTLSKWKVWDPEFGDGNGAHYPNTTAYNVGLRVTFN